MGDPDRWLGKASGSDEVERELLGSLRDVSPRAGSKDETWNRLAVQISAAAVVGTAAGTAATAAHVSASSGAGIVAHATKWMTAKVLLSAALAGSTAVGGALWISERSTHETAPTPAPPRGSLALPPVERAAPEVPKAEAPPEMIDVPAPRTPAIKGDRAAKSDCDARGRDLLAVESRMLTDARAQLHARDPRGALTTLERLRNRSPKGMLMQERDVLTIQALAAVGDTAAAKQRAKEFLTAYPESPHAPQLRRLTGVP